jgi:hypothetical protein
LGVAAKYASSRLNDIIVQELESETPAASEEDES